MPAWTAGSAGDASPGWVDPPTPRHPILRWTLRWSLRIAAITAAPAYYFAMALGDWRPAWYVGPNVREWNLVAACALASVFIAGLCTIPRRALRYTSIAVFLWIFVSYQQMFRGPDRPPYAATLRLPSGDWLVLESFDVGGATTSGMLSLRRLSPAGPLHRVSATLDRREGASRGTLRRDGRGGVVARIEFHSGAIVETRWAVAD